MKVAIPPAVLVRRITIAVLVLIVAVALIIGLKPFTPARSTLGGVVPPGQEIMHDRSRSCIMLGDTGESIERVVGI